MEPRLVSVSQGRRARRRRQGRRAFGLRDQKDWKGGTARPQGVWLSEARGACRLHAGNRDTGEVCQVSKEVRSGLLQ